MTVRAGSKAATLEGGLVRLMAKRPPVAPATVKAAAIAQGAGLAEVIGKGDKVFAVDLGTGWTVVRGKLGDGVYQSLRVNTYGRDYDGPADAIALARSRRGIMIAKVGNHAWVCATGELLAHARTLLPEVRESIRKAAKSK